MTVKKKIVAQLLANVELNEPNFDKFEEKMAQSQAQMDKVAKELDEVSKISDETLRMRFTI